MTRKDFESLTFTYSSEKDPITGKPIVVTLTAKDFS
jgi:hypothetical protein